MMPGLVVQDDPVGGKRVRLVMFLNERSAGEPGVALLGCGYVARSTTVDRALSRISSPAVQ